MTAPANDHSANAMAMTTRRYPSTIATSVEHELVVKKSRFLAHVFPLQEATEAEAIIASIRRRHWTASHNCVALITGQLGDHARSSDDGEPAGTAGAPLLEVLRRRELTDVLVVVTRYFGGVKLGTGGLARAYAQAASEALDAAGLVPRQALVRATVLVPHADAGRYDHLLREWVSRHDAALESTTYGAQAELALWVSAADVDQLTTDLAAASSGAVRLTLGEERIMSIPRDKSCASPPR